MNKYHIKRVDPNTGQIWAIGPYGEEYQVSETMSYTDCKIYLLQNQTKLQIYKVAKIGSRKGAKRHLYKRICASDIVEAMEIFNDLVREENTTLQLNSGDWKLIAEKPPTGKTKLYFK